MLRQNDITRDIAGDRRVAGAKNTSIAFASKGTANGRITLEKYGRMVAMWMHIGRPYEIDRAQVEKILKA